MGTTIADLPQLVLERVLEYLPVSDRLSCARTWNRWANCNPRLFDDVWLFIPGSGMTAAEAILSKSHRQYRKLRLSKMELCDYNPEFWRKLGGNLRELVICDCSRLSAVFYRILRDCVMLESLEISNSGGPIGILCAELPEDISVEELRQSLRNMRHLRLGVLLEGQTFDRLIGLIPNLSSISLSKLDETGASKFLQLLSTTNVKITELTLPGAPLSEENWINLIRASTSSLRKLHMDDDFVGSGTYQAIGDCTELRHFLVGAYFSLTDSHLENILRNNPSLETLSFDRCGTVSIAGFAAIFRLANIHRLSFSALPTNTIGIIFHPRRLARICLPTLQELNLNVKVDAETLRSIAQLPNLRALCVNCALWDPECVEILFEMFQNLTALDLGDCKELTDADLVKLRKFRDLKSLRFTAGGGFTDLVFRDGLGSTALESLALRRSTVTGVGLAGIGVHHPHLKTFELVGCENVTDDGLITLLRCLPLLDTLKVEGDSLSDKFLEALEELCPRLRTLGIHGSASGNADAVNVFVTRRPAVDVTY